MPEKKKGHKATIEFKFLKRIANGDTAYEVGVYKIGFTVKGKGRLFYLSCGTQKGKRGLENSPGLGQQNDGKWQKNNCRSL